MYTARIPGWPMMAIMILIVVFSAEAKAQTTLIDFEDASIPTGSMMAAQYGSRGVIFKSGQLGPHPAAHSGQRVVNAIVPGEEVFEVKPFVIYFTGPNVTRVKLYAGGVQSLTGKLTAFDAETGGNIIKFVEHFVPKDTFTTAFEVTAVGTSIKRVELQLENTSYVSIDDLEFDGNAGPMPTQMPIVQLTQPINNTDVDIPGDLPRLDIAGTVTGEGLLSSVRVIVSVKQPPESSAPPLSLVLSLTGSGTTRQFTLDGGMSPIALGPVTVTATAENIAGLKGTATSTVTNLPRSVRDKFFDLGGTNTLGEFQYGLLKECSIAVYERGAISGWAAGAIDIRGEIFTKWLSLRGPFNQRGWFGCPKTSEGPTFKDARSQTFERGRIYYINVLNFPFHGAVYVPDVFVQAIDKRGGDASIGLPLSDPIDSPGKTQTWLFQRFDKPHNPNDPEDEPYLLPSTLEIRGIPPKLWIERQIGTWLTGPGLDKGVFYLTDFDKERKKTPATLWESFDCKDDKDADDKHDKFLGPCPVTDEPVFPPPITPENKPDFKNKFCSGGTYIPASPWGPPEWKAIRGQYDATPVFGFAFGDQMATIDNGLTHRTHNGNCPHLGWLLSIGSVLSGVPIEAGVNVLEQEYGVTCVSDYEFFVRPLGPQIDTRPQLPNLYSEKHPDRIKAEYEAAYAAEAHNFLGNPRKGDLIHMTGRWIVDCGHSPYKTELHPIFSFARMKTVESETNAFTQAEDALFGGRPATRVAIWVNGWYPGGNDNAIEFDIYPPPRPSPTATLRVVKPMNSGSGGYRAAVDVELVDSIRPFGSATYVHLRFTASRRANPVSGAGEMVFLPGRQYWGIWYLYWAE